MEPLNLNGSEHEGIEGPADVQVSLAEDEVADFITGKPVKLKGNEEVRQRIARALFYEYGIRTLDMQRDFPIPVNQDGQRRATKKADIGIFEPGAPHTPEKLRRVVICKPEPKGGRAMTKVRTFEQAGKDLDELTTLLGTEATPQVEYGMWTNGIDFFFLHEEVGRFSATRVSLRTRRPPEFYTTPAEPFTEDGRKAIRKRIESLFTEVKDAYPLFTARDELTLSDRALAFIVGELAPYNLTGTDADVKGIAY